MLSTLGPALATEQSPPICFICLRACGVDDYCFGCAAFICCACYGDAMGLVMQRHAPNLHLAMLRPGEMILN